MNTLTTISSKYQIVIPREVREQFNLKPGQKLMFIPFQKSIRLVIVPSVKKCCGMFEGINTKNLREEEDEGAFMNVVDLSGWIEYFANEKNAKFFLSPIRDLDHLIIPTICIYEVFKRLLVERGEDAALQAVGVMSHGQVIELDREVAMEAAQISLDLKLAMADSIILATARAQNATLWTQDEHFKDIKGVKYIEKKRS